MGEADAVGERVLCGSLQVGIDRQAHVVPCLRQLLELARARHAAERVDEHAADARQAA
jgi:hypothetical protein